MKTKKSDFMKNFTKSATDSGIIFNDIGDCQREFFFFTGSVIMEL